MELTRRIAAVGFDVDGTLYPNGAMQRRVLRRVLRNLRFFYAYGRVRSGLRERGDVDVDAASGGYEGPGHGKPGRAVPDGVRAEAEPRTIGFYEEQSRLTAVRLGIPVAEARSRIQRLVYDGLLRSLERVAPVPGLVELLNELYEAGVPMGLLSDFPVGRKPELLGLPDVWRCRLCTEEIGALKPHNEPFRALAECLEVQAQQVLFVGNSFNSDILGAKNAGMMAAHFVPQSSRTARRRNRAYARKAERTGNMSPAADITFSDYRELAEWLQMRPDPTR